MSKLGSALGKKYEENRLAVLSRSFEDRKSTRLNSSHT